MVESTQNSSTRLNFLPKHSKQFQEQEFWSTFFKAKKTGNETSEEQKEGDESFEWYAEFEDLEPYLREIIDDDETKKIMVPGCGDSNLSEKLCTKMGQDQVVSIDFENDVIEKMNKKGIEGVTYMVMDFLAMQFEDDDFDIVLDKGSFDALCCD